MLIPVVRLQNISRNSKACHPRWLIGRALRSVRLARAADVRHHHLLPGQDNSLELSAA
jgi:hypothetical protein